MKVCIFGAGAVGGYFGGRLAQSGIDVTFIARGAHLDAIKAHGLNVKSINGDFTVLPAKATDRLETVGTVDVVLCCVKSWQVPAAAKQMNAIVGPETVVIPLLNGVEAHDMLSRALGAEHVMPGLCKLITIIDSPGHIRHAGADPYLAFGELDGSLSERGKKVARLFAGAKGMNVHLSQNIISQLWQKIHADCAMERYGRTDPISNWCDPQYAGNKDHAHGFNPRSVRRCAGQWRRHR